MATLEDLKKLKSNTVSGAVQNTLNFLKENNISTEDVLNALGTDSDRSEGRIDPIERKVDADTIDSFIARQSKGSPIPGASLTRGKDERYHWERPPQFASAVDALGDIESRLLTEEGMAGVLRNLINGYTVTDLTNVMLYNDFLQGKYTPDVMLQVYEPTAVMIMAIGEKGRVNFKIDDEADPEEEDMAEDQMRDLNNKVLPQMKKIQQVALQGSLNTSILPEETKNNLLDKTERITSLLGRTT